MTLCRLLLHAGIQLVPSLSRTQLDRADYSVLASTVRRSHVGRAAVQGSQQEKGIAEHTATASRIEGGSSGRSQEGRVDLIGQQLWVFLLFVTAFGVDVDAGILWLGAAGGSM